MRHFIKIYTKNKNIPETIKNLIGKNYLYMENDKTSFTFIVQNSLSETTMEKLVNKIYTKYPEDEIYFENSTNAKEFTDEQIQTMLEELSRYMHNKSMSEKMALGWRYGEKFDPNEKTSPLIKPYEDLPSEHKKLRPDIFAKVMEIISKQK
jgi:hypothetical protein